MNLKIQRSVLLDYLLYKVLKVALANETDARALSFVGQSLEPDLGGQLLNLAFVQISQGKHGALQSPLGDPGQEKCLVLEGIGGY